MDLNELKVLAGIKKDYPKENLSISGTEKSKLQKLHNIKPGTPEWFKLWFSKTKLTGEKPVESYTRDELPQIKNQHLKYISHTLENFNIDNLIPVQTERIQENLNKQISNLRKNKYNPIIIDKDNKIVNGHHRYTAAKTLGITEVKVARINLPLKTIIKEYKKFMETAAVGKLVKGVNTTVDVGPKQDKIEQAKFFNPKFYKSKKK
jgi:hypothetical protein